MAFHATAALRQYFRAHLVLHVAAIRQRQAGHSPSKQVTDRCPLFFTKGLMVTSGMVSDVCHKVIQ